ncbi:MAG: hypothetical protein RMK93_01055 [Bacteroidota bacterium]|nr:hypothetical protein [Bacteroidota bacterium]
MPLSMDGRPQIQFPKHSGRQDPRRARTSHEQATNKRRIHTSGTMDPEYALHIYRLLLFAGWHQVIE